MHNYYPTDVVRERAKSRARVDIVGVTITYSGSGGQERNVLLLNQ
jgi:hypothetical protein